VLGGILALLSAASFAFNNASIRRGVLTGSVAQAMAITVPIGVPVFFLATLVTGTLAAVADFSSKAILALCVAGPLHFVWGRYCNYRATRALGSNLVAPAQQVNMIITLSLAVWILGEVLTPMRIAGILLVLLGPAFTLREKEAKAPGAAAADAPADSDAEVIKNGGAKPAPFVPNYAEGYTFALLSATGYGVSPILVRFAIEDKGIGMGIAGGLVSYSAATALMLLILLWPGQLRHALSVKPESAKWFTISGFLVCISQMFLYTAMTLAPVTVVTPITRLSILFRLYFSRLLNPHHEVFGGRVVLGTIVSLSGALLLSLSADTVAALVPLPDALVRMLHWHWP
jgi:drug/metabolite transporter (DMT)-like permease